MRIAITDVIQASQPARAALDGEPETVESSGAERLSQGDWDVADLRASKLKLILEAPKPTKKLVQEVAEALGKSVATIYRWRLEFNERGTTALAPYHPTGGRGKSRMDDIVEDVINTAIEDHFLTDQRLKISKLMDIIRPRCQLAKLPVPHENTVRLRVAWLSDKAKDEARDGQAGKKRHRPAPGRYGEASHPNSVWQVDHTPLDVCIVDDVYRKNIGRVWATVVIDVYSRCVMGFYLSLDKPNATSVGMALVHAILPKEGWLAAKGIDASWATWGKPVTVHADNDRTFRCEMVTRAAKQHHINLEWRPVATPHWGGHIERLLGTVNSEIQTISGTTFSNPSKRGSNKPHEDAEFTFDQVEEYLVKFLCGVYHNRKHSGIGRPPIRQFERGILGDGVARGTGLPAPILDPMRLRLDFLPLDTKTVQNNGVTWDLITYYDPVIDRWIHARDPEYPTRKRKFTLRRDPRDLAFVWFLDPDRDVYLKLPYKNLEHPSITLWELRAVRAHLAAESNAEVDEDLIFDTLTDLQRIKETASQETQQARKANQKRKVYHGKKKAEIAQVEHARPKGAAPSSVEEPRGSQKEPAFAELVDDDEIEQLAIHR